MLWSPNTQLHYPFQNSALDYSGSARHGTINGSGVFATKPNGSRCLYFDGVGDYVATPSFGLSGTVVVFACWVRCKFHAVVIQSLLSDRGWSATVPFIWTYRERNNHLYWRYADGTASSVAIASDYFQPPYDDEWLHLCIVCDYSGKNTHFFRNGISIATVGMTGTPVFPNLNNLKVIGARNTVPEGCLTDGYLQNVQLWTLATMPPLAQVTANVNRLMLGMNPIG